jgi:Domain of unknown function (DUF1707)
MLTTPARWVHTPRIDDRAVSLRASDADRDRVARTLRQHLLAGRLVTEEFEQRIERAYAARTVDELRVLTRDLPGTGVRSTGEPTRRLLLPGNRPFAVRFEADESPSVVVSEAMRTIGPDLMAARYRMERSEPTRLVLRREQYPFSAVAAAILIPFLGLIALLAGGREASEIVISANELERGRTIVDVFGVASLRVRRAMLELDR